jgi:hypothetical protein
LTWSQIWNLGVQLTWLWSDGRHHHAWSHHLCLCRVSASLRSRLCLWLMLGFVNPLACTQISSSSWIMIGTFLRTFLCSQSQQSVAPL